MVVFISIIKLLNFCCYFEIQRAPCSTSEVEASTNIVLPQPPHQILLYIYYYVYYYYYYYLVVLHFIQRF